MKGYHSVRNSCFVIKNNASFISSDNLMEQNIFDYNLEPKVRFRKIILDSFLFTSFYFPFFIDIEKSGNKIKFNVTKAL